MPLYSLTQAITTEPYLLRTCYIVPWVYVVEQETWDQYEAYSLVRKTYMKQGIGVNPTMRLRYHRQLEKDV